MARSDHRERLLNAALTVIRTKGYAGTTVDDICTAAGVTKGSFFHHFASKEALAVAAAGQFCELGNSLFQIEPYRADAPALERVFAYLDLRITIIRGGIPEFTCLLGTMAQETYETHPAIREACGQGIVGHASRVAQDLAEAKRLHAPDADWDPQSVALFTQASIQGAFVLAKATNRPETAVECLRHLRHYIELLFPHIPTKEDRPMAQPLVQPYLMFAGRCQEALDFYTAGIGAKVEFVMHYSDSPEPVPAGMLESGFEKKIMHCSFRIGQSVVMASDGCNSKGGFQGVTLSLSVATEAEAEKAFNALVQGGKVTMPLAKTFWSPKFGMLTDKFGLDWMVSVPGEMGK